MRLYRAVQERDATVYVAAFSMDNIYRLMVLGSPAASSLWTTFPEAL